MLKLNDFRVGWRQLVGDPAYSAVVLLGLAIAIGCAYLIGVFVSDVVQVDSQVPEPARLVSFELRRNPVGREVPWTDASPFALRGALLASRAPVEHVTRTMSRPVSMRVGERVAKVDLMLADPGLAPLFGLKPLAGDLVAALTRPDGVALTEVAAERLFGTRQALGRQLQAKGQTLTVLALLPLPAGNSRLKYEAIAGFESQLGLKDEVLLTSWGMLSGQVWARLAPGAGVAQLSALGQGLLDSSPDSLARSPEQRAEGRKMAFLRAMPMPDYALTGARSGPRRLLLGSLAAAALAMLALAGINYINLTSVRTLRRQREIGIRKSLGAGPARLVGQFLTESVVVALVAGLLGLLMAWLLAPSFAELMRYRYDDRLLSANRLLACVAGCVALGLLTGLYPAWVALKVRCAESLAGRSHSENAQGRWVRRAMTTVQFSAAITLSALAVVVLWQTAYASDIRTGFRRDGVLAIDLPEPNPSEAPAGKDDRGRGLRDALLREPSVAGATSAMDAPGRNWSTMMAFLKTTGPELMLRAFEVGPHFFDVFELPVLAGRIAPEQDADTDKSMVLDRLAATRLGFADPQAAIGQTVVDEDQQAHTVVAVVESARLENARDLPMPKVYLPRKTVDGVLSVRSTDLAATRQAIARLWPRYFPDQVADVETLQHYLEQNYREDRRLGGLVAAASLVALLLASFGVYALAAYTVRQKTREIVIRKLHGAGHRAIGALLLREFAGLLAVGVVVGLPLSWLMSQQYLGNFAERAPMGAWPLLAALAVALLVSGLATLRHTLAALALRPTLALQG